MHVGGMSLRASLRCLFCGATWYANTAASKITRDASVVDAYLWRRMGTWPTSGQAGTPRNACTRRPHRCPCGTLESRVTPMASPWPDRETTRHRRVQESNHRSAPMCVELQYTWALTVARTRRDAGTSACAGRGRRSKMHPNMTSKCAGARAQHRSTCRLDSSSGPAESMMRVQDRGEPDGRPHRRCEGPSSGHQESS